MSYSIRWDINILDVATGAEAAVFVAEQTQMVNNWGTRGSTMWLGPHGVKRRDMPLRIDIDPDSDTAAIRWLPDDLVGAEAGVERSEPIKVAESSMRELVEIPAELVRASIATARAAAAEYVDTGQRPSLTWEPVT